MLIFVYPQISSSSSTLAWAWLATDNFNRGFLKPLETSLDMPLLHTHTCKAMLTAAVTQLLPPSEPALIYLALLRHLSLVWQIFPGRASNP